MARVALVTGGTRGIGAAISTGLKAAGFTVAANYAGNVEKAEAFKAETGISVFRFDVSDPEAAAAGVKAVEAELGPVDVLVNNAGIPAAGFPQVDFKDSDPELWRRFVDLNLYGVMNCTHSVLGAMCERGWGRVVTISSEAARVGLPIRVALYGAAKAGAVGLMKHVAHEVGPAGVTCNVLTLGGMEGIPGDPSRQPIPRMGTGRDVGATVAFLASDGAEWITGQVIGINGGAVT